MEHQTSASIEILGSVLRYAEVEREGDVRRLVRLGSCDFDFNLEDVVSGDGEGEWIETLSHAVRDILAGSSALDLHVALHRPLGSSLFVPIPVDTPKKERLRRLWQDVAVAFPGEETAFSAELVRSEVLSDGESIEWWHVLAVPARVAEILERVLSKSEVGRRRFCAAMSGAAAIIRQVARDQVEETPVSTPYRIAIGRYSARTEFLIVRNQAWQYGTAFVAKNSTDRLFHILKFLDGTGVTLSEIKTVYSYGSEADTLLYESLMSVTESSPVPLDPLMVVDHQVEGLAAGVSIDAYAPCIGANLRDVYS